MKPSTLWLSLCGLSHAYLVGPPSVATGAGWVPPSAQPQARSSATMILGAIKDKAAELVVAEKVSKKLSDAQERYNIPVKYVTVLKGFFVNYVTEVYKNGGDMELAEDLLGRLLKQVLTLAKEPYAFEPYHRAIREPFDYYAMGQDFARGLVDMDNSLCVGADNVGKIQEQLAAGDNVVLLANHQSEADPQIFSILLDESHPGFAEATIFVAGDRVTTDMLAMPFSMGRNLLCIFSKKHVDNPPEQKSAKQRHNKMVMKRMQELFKEGGKCIWVAPSGGRDRPNEETGEYECAPFDAKSVEMFRLMSDKAKRNTHFYPLSMLTFANCPPPSSVGGAVGEERTVKYAAAGLHFADEVNLELFKEGCVVDNFPEGCTEDSTREELRDALALYCHKTVNENYKALEVKLL